MSVKSGPFYKGLEFINKIVDHVDLSPTNGRVGFIEFAHKVICLQRSVLQIEVQSRIGSIGFSRATVKWLYHLANEVV